MPRDSGNEGSSEGGDRVENRPVLESERWGARGYFSTLLSLLTFRSRLREVTLSSERHSAHWCLVTACAGQWQKPPLCPGHLSNSSRAVGCFPLGWRSADLQMDIPGQAHHIPSVSWPRGCFRQKLALGGNCAGATTTAEARAVTSRGGGGSWEGRSLLRRPSRPPWGTGRSRSGRLWTCFPNCSILRFHFEYHLFGCHGNVVSILMLTCVAATFYI